MINFPTYFLEKFRQVIDIVDINDIENLVTHLSKIKSSRGRLFFVGNGGSVASASHSVNDFRKIAGIECYNISDNISELSARTNDEGFHTVFIEWLKESNLTDKDALFILSVGGADKEKNISTNIVLAIDYAKSKGCKIFGIVGRDGGYTAQKGDCVIIIPSVDENLITPIVESFHSIICHLLVSHPSLKENQTKWESIK